MILASARRGATPDPFRGPDVEWLFCGTVAVYRAARRLGLGEGDVVLVPAYNCGIEVDAILHCGARVVFYRVGRDGRVDLEDAERRRTANARAILVIHYFGFPQDVEAVVAWAGARGLHVVEDCAHAWLSRAGERHLGTFGDVGIFSPRKSLAVMDGGVLLSRDKRESPGSPLVPPDWRHGLRELVDSLGRRFSPAVGAPLRRAVRGWRPGGVEPLIDLGSEHFGAVADRLDWRMSWLSRRILLATDQAEVVRRRRRNFLQLLGALPRSEGLAPLFEHLPEGVCPLHFPLVVADRDPLHQRLRARGIESFRFWQWSHPLIQASEHPEAFWLRARVLTLPIHQDLDESDMAFVAEALADAARR
jgi:dTDP-4-amino-4,6-dideoxygalactose transaminase